MKKIIIGFITMLALTHGAYAEVKPNEPVEHKVVEIHMSTKKVVTEDSKKKTKIQTVPITGAGTCSGSFIDDMGDILTAKHCVSGFDLFEVVTFDEKRYAAIVIATSPTHDLALIHIDRVNTEYFKIAANVIRGEQISVLGSPLGITDTLTQGTIAKLDGDILLIDCTVIPGNSGGPVFDAAHNLVGVATAMYVVLLGPAHLNIVQSNEAVWFFLMSVLSKR